jgi:chromosome segregation ATPase
LVQELEANVSEIRSREEEAQIAVEPLKQAVRDLKKEVADKKNLVDAAEQDKGQASIQVAETESQLRKLGKQIAIERQKQSLDHKSLEDEVERKVSILNSKIEGYRNDIEEVKHF